MSDSLALCVPAYNAAKHLPRLFESVRQQTTVFDEILVYDDASVDDTAAVARQLGARVIRGEVNLGCSAGKNALLSQVSTDWVHFHDSDDTLAPEFVSRAKTRIRGGGFDVLLLDYEQIDATTGARMSRSNFGATDLADDPVRYMLANTVNNGGVYAVRLLREAGGFDLDPAVRYNEDRAFHLRLAETGARFATESYIGSQFYFTPDSMSAANRALCCLAHFEITRRFANKYPGRYRAEVGRLAWVSAAGLSSFLNWDAADTCVRLACATTGKVPPEAGGTFRFMCKMDPHLAIRAREGLIRLIKPKWRKGYPGWRLRSEPGIKAE